MKVYAVILAGGKGERLWPVSTPERPKPFLPLGAGGRSLLRATYERVLPVVGESQVFVVVDREHASLVQTELGLAGENIIIEPQGKNTAPAIGLAAAILQTRAPESVMIVLPSDHLIGEEDRFRQALRIAIETANSGYLVTFGIIPTYPASSYGYIQCDRPLNEKVFYVRRFVEKPDCKTAEHFLSEGGYFWNSGIFVWQTRRILEEIRRYLPKLAEVLEELTHFYGTSLWWSKLTELWSQVEPISVDYGVMERAQGVVVIPIDVKWSDVGDWRAVWEVLPKQDGDVAQIGDHFGIDTFRTLVWATGGKRVVTIGVKDLIIVDTSEALLVADISRAQEVREAVRRLTKLQEDRKRQSGQQ